MFIFFNIKKVLPQYGPVMISSYWGRGNARRS